MSDKRYVSSGKTPSGGGQGKVKKGATKRYKEEPKTRG